jgi:hypothetical protein
MTRADVENRIGIDRFLGELRAHLKDGSYRPQPVRERSIPKRGGKMRRLGISTLRDRVVQMALKLVLEPIFEAGVTLFRPDSVTVTRYRYRGAKIATPWSIEQLRAQQAAFRRVHDERGGLERLQQRLVTA